jgi:hypothetical protein
MYTLPTPKEIFQALKEELERRKFQVRFQGDRFTAVNRNYTHLQVRIVAVLNPESGVTVTIDHLTAQEIDAIMLYYMEYFDLTVGRSEVVMEISAEMQAYRDMGEVANILTRAYSRGVITT